MPLATSLISPSHPLPLLASPLPPKLTLQLPRLVTPRHSVSLYHTPCHSASHLSCHSVICYSSLPPLEIPCHSFSHPHTLSATLCHPSPLSLTLLHYHSLCHSQAPVGKGLGLEGLLGSPCNNGQANGPMRPMRLIPGPKEMVSNCPGGGVQPVQPMTTLLGATAVGGSNCWGHGRGKPVASGWLIGSR